MRHLAHPAPALLLWALTRFAWPSHLEDREDR